MAQKPYFEKIDTKVDFSSLERELLFSWEKKDIVKKYLEKNKDNSEYFSFLDGPITANNPMGVHHGWGRSYKDLYQRYKNMRGYKQRFQNGFDAQGLWVEVEVEKELGFKNKKDIEEYGVAKFVQKCKDRVLKYSKIQMDQSKRLGYFMDWDNSYYTMSDENNYMIWHFIKVCHENGWLYKGKDSVPWCPRCQTAISQHEMLTEDYKEVTHKSIYFSLPIKGQENEYLLVWTTTPWTIPANIAVAVDTKMDYSLVELGNKRYWLAKDVIKRVFGNKKIKLLKTVHGDRLTGLKYEGPFDDLPAVKKARKENIDLFHQVVATDNLIMPINTNEGTGLVHTAVSAGTEDFKLGKKLGLPMIPVIDDSANYLEGLGEFEGKNAKNNPEIVLNYMEKLEGDWVYKIEDYKHRYPGCWRCSTELVWKVTDVWYIAMDKGEPTLRERMIEVVTNITWIPGFGLKRELDWLNNMHDWLISKKNRYWGLCLPIWECNKCKHFEVIGSKKELKERATKGWKEFEGKSPHKPHIDKVIIECEKCGSESTRIEPVGNPWLDAGIVPFSTISSNNKAPLYETKRDEWEKWYPADFITESFPGQFKNWFYSLIAMSTVLENKEPFKTVLGFATLLAEDGRAMHKSWGNAIEFNEGADKIGVDVMRWMYLRQNVTDNLLFGYKTADETRRRFHLKLWNVYNFFVTYANLDEWIPPKRLIIKKQDQKPLDKWINLRLSETVNTVTHSLDKFNAMKAVETIEEFVDDLSNWYVRRSRDRGGVAATDAKDKEVFYKTLYSILVKLSKILAPFTPFMADLIYTNLTKKDSVHLASWPDEEKVTEKKLLSDMETVRRVVEVAHSLRKEKELAVRVPLKSLTTVLDVEVPSRNLSKYLEEEVNVKEWIVKKGKTFENKLDTKMTKELEEEAKARELIRTIQTERRKMKAELKDKVKVFSPWIPDNEELKDKVMAKTLATSLTKGKFRVIKSS